ncbi:hypothetical protein [Sphingobium baderi]|uniref:hypothetical protein n=1 Tax=Sphingobium baderi TaxID=1332080 RepID=UPI0018D2145E|nr:hypothetical protein [Sphingobium baderi]
MGIAAANSDDWRSIQRVTDRCWRETRDHGRVVLPTLFARLELRRAGSPAAADLDRR